MIARSPVFLFEDTRRFDLCSYPAAHAPRLVVCGLMQTIIFCDNKRAQT